MMAMLNISPYFYAEVKSQLIKFTLDRATADLWFSQTLKLKKTQESLHVAAVPVYN